MTSDIFSPETGSQARKETGRMEALSDGIFAIAMTLLVLEIHVPEVSGDDSLARAVLDEWPALLAFVVGFFTLLICWINHHYMFDAIDKTNGILMLLNGCKLLVVSFTPFATALLSHFINTSHEQAAVSIYALNFFAMGMSMTCLWCYACHRRLAHCTTPEIQAFSTRLYLFATVIPGTIFLFSFISIWPSLLLFCFMFAVYVYPQATVRSLARRGLVAKPVVQVGS
jgi:uncharacterized membrane protein